MQARRDEEVACAVAREVGARRRYRQAKADWDFLGGTPGWGCKGIAEKHGIPLV